MATSPSFLQALTQKYYQQMGAPQPASVKRQGLYDLGKMAPERIDPNSFAGRVEGAVGEHSTLGKIIDVVSRPLYAVSENAEEKSGAAIDLITGSRKSNFGKALKRGDNPINAAFNATVGSAMSGLAGRSKTLPSDMLEGWEPQNGAEGTAKFATGLGLDIAFDPLTYIPGGVIAGAARKAPGVAKATSSLRKAGHLEKEAYEAFDDAAEEVIAPTPAQKAPETWPENWPSPDEMGQLHRDPKLVFGQIPKAPQQSIRQVADAPRDAAGKRVYDFKRLPSLYSSRPKPAPKAKPTAPKDIQEWIQQNLNQPLTRDADKRLHFTDDPDGVTLGQILKAAKDRGLNPVSLETHRSVRELYEATVAKTAPSPADVAAASAERAVAGSRGQRIRDAKRAKNLAYLRDKLDPEDYIYLARARSAASFKERRQEILSRVHSPVEASLITDAPVDAISRQALGEPVAAAKVGPRQALNPTDPVAGRALNSVARSQFKPEGYRHRSKVKDVARTNVKEGKGLGKADRGLNKRAQYDAWKIIVNHHSSKLKSAGLSGGARATVMRREVLRSLDEYEAVARSRGLEPIAGSGHSGIAISLGDVIHAMTDHRQTGLESLLTHLFNISNEATVAPTNLIDAAEEIILTMKKAGVTSVEEAREFAKGINATRGEKGGLYDIVGRILAIDPRGKYGTYDDALKRAREAGAPERRKGFTKREAGKRQWDKEAKHSVYAKQKDINTGGKEFSDAVEAVRKALFSDSAIADLVGRHIANSARFNAQLGYEVQRISDDVIEEFFKTWMRPATTLGEKIYAYQRVDAAADAAGDAIDAMPASRNAAKDIVQDEIDDVIADDLPIIESLQKINAAKTLPEKMAAGQRHMDDIFAEVNEELPVGSSVDDISTAMLEQGILRSAYPLLSSMPTELVQKSSKGIDSIIAKVTPQHGHATIRPALTEAGSLSRNLANSWRNRLSMVNRVFSGNEGRARLTAIFEQIKNGSRVENLTSQEERAVEVFRGLMSALFEPNAERGLKATSNTMFRNGSDVDHVNARLEVAKMPEHMRFDLDAAKTSAEQNGTDVMEELADQWRAWKVDDPVDFMARMQHAALGLHTDMAIARGVASIAKGKNLMSMKPRPGFSQITDSTGKSVMARYLPHGAYFHKDVIPEIAALDNILQQSQIIGGEFGNFIHRYMDPVLNAWKAGMTIYRPGHHMRNFIGDLSFSFNADGVPRMQHATGALKIMTMRGNYDDFSALRALQGLAPDSGKITEATLHRGDEIVAHATLKGGKKVPLTAKAVQDFTRSRGMLPDFASGEDLLQSADRSSETIRAIQERMSFAGGNVRRAAGKVSESRDDFIRLSHFLQIIEKHGSKFKDVDELMEFAVRRVRKWHPDGTDLTPFESKYMRRIFPFYSWSRKAIPLVMESMLLQPGRVMMWPKAVYNAAQAAGLDPVSLSEPFPEDQLFPSFLTDEMTGPMGRTEDGRYYGINPGVASADVLNQFVGDPKAGILGMLSPLIKGPAEVTFGTRADTGTPINDMSEYIGSNIPGVSHAQSLTGTDIFGTLFGGQGHEPMHSVERGNREPIDRNTIINLLTGLGIQDMSKPSYINFAEIERRDRARREAERGY